jgi:hypothetical protein
MVVLFLAGHSGRPMPLWWGKKTLNHFFPFVVVAALFKKSKSGCNLPNKKTLPVTEYYYLLFWIKHQTLIAKTKRKTHLNSKFCEIIFKKHPNFKNQEAYRSVVIWFLLFRQRFSSSVHSCQNGYFSLLHAFSKPFSKAAVGVVELWPLTGLWTRKIKLRPTILSSLTRILQKQNYYKKKILLPLFWFVV